MPHPHPHDIRILDLIAQAEREGRPIPTMRELSQLANISMSSARWALYRLIHKGLLENNFRKARTYRIPKGNRTTFQGQPYYLIMKGKKNG
jgi:DNA-binding IclR family transcriptional regulator